jgi:hypothetical protein
MPTATKTNKAPKAPDEIPAPVPAPDPAPSDEQAALLGLAEFSSQESTAFRPIWYATKEMGFVADVEQVTEMTGVILAVRRTRRHSVYDETAGKRVPECLLTHLEPDYGTVLATGELRECAICPFDKWGSATDDKGNPTRGKACREKRLLLFLRDGDALPVVVAAPPTSIRTVENFKNLAETRGQPLPTIHVKLTVARQTQGERAYGVLQVTNLGQLAGADIRDLWGRVQYIRDRVQQWLKASAASIDRDDVEDEAEAGEGQAAAGEPAAAAGAAADRF